MYSEYLPARCLANYIDAYWTSEMPAGMPAFTNRILPDTCTDIIINLGARVTSVTGEKTSLEADKCYLVGTMTKFSEVRAQAETKIWGIRFKPFGLQALMGHTLSGTSNKRFELSESEFTLKHIFYRPPNEIPALLDRYFTTRIPAKASTYIAICDTIHRVKGVMTISELCREHYISERQLERIFIAGTGVSAKEICGQVRLQHTIKAIKNRRSQQDLLSIALDLGYCDHAHLSNSVKKYTGYSPTHFAM